MIGWRAALTGALLLGALNTLGDFIWARGVPHRVAYGLLHGTVLLMALGAFLGALRDWPGAGTLGGAAVGLAAAASFYAIMPLLGYPAMFVSWMALWLGFAILDARILSRGSPLRAALVRGALAAGGSGLAFYAVSGIWLRPRAGGPDYPYHFLCWTLAFLPGLAALLVRRRPKREPVAPAPR